MTNLFYRIVFIFSIFCFTTFGGNAQTTDINNQVNTLVNTLKRHGRNPDSLMFYGNKLLSLSNEYNHDLGKFRAYLSLGQASLRKGDVKTSNIYYHNALGFSHLAENNEAVIGIMSNLGINHRRLRRNDSAMYYFKEVQKRYLVLGLEEPASMNHMNIGITFMQYQELDSAEYYFKRSLAGFGELGNERVVSQNLSLLGEVQYQKENYQEAIAFADSSLAISKRINFQPNYGRNYSLLARIYEKIGNEEKVKEYKSLEEEFRLKDPRTVQISRELNEKSATENAKRNIKTLNELKEGKAFYKTNLFLSLIALLALGVLVVFLFKKNKRIQAEVKELQKKIDTFKNTSDVVDILASNNIVLKSKAVVNCGQILYVKSDGHYVEYYLEGKSKPEVDRNTMVDVLNELPETSFVRIHKSFIVNLHRIKIINSTRVMLDSGEWINLSRTYKPLLHKALNKE